MTNNFYTLFLNPINGFFNNEFFQSSSDYIVFLDEALIGRDLNKASKDVLEGVGLNVEPKIVFDQLNGFVVNLNEEQAQRLRNNNIVKVVEKNFDVFLEPPIDATSVTTQQSTNSTVLAYYNDSTASTGDVLPWGVRAVWGGEDVSKRGNYVNDSYVFVIDSGVLNTTGDLNLASDSSWHRSWITGEDPFTDGAGHGTHVASTVAALANGKGIVGVAPGAQVISLKVFDSSNSTSNSSSIVEAINHAVYIINTYGLDKNKVVINMSLSSIYSTAFDIAVKTAADQGIRFAIAAGNQGKDADGYSPASAGDHSNVYTVSAVNSSYGMPSWSNWDRIDSTDSVDDVDFAAPGVNVLAYYKNGQLANLSGTSMATPHVAGLLLTGGIKGSSLATPAYSGSADPFAVNIFSDPQFQPPTYTLSSNTSVNEGQSILFSLSTINVDLGTPVYWKVSGTNITLSDFVGLAKLDGQLTTSTTGTGQVSLTLNNDVLTEGIESFKFELFADNTFVNKVNERSVTIQDTSVYVIPPIVSWGTSGNDVITGGGGNDRLAGVLSSGTDAVSMGMGQIDVVTGSSGADVFIVGDARGWFYDNRIQTDVGANDYLLIKDFKLGEDKLQVKRGAHVFTPINNNLYFYRDLNANGTLQLDGVNRDELIAVIEGITTISRSDYVII